MGNVTAKVSGEIASFMSPSMTNIKSLKVHFSPKQLGTGDPSPENIREIEGWDGVEVNGSGKNIAHIVGYSAKNSDSNNSRSVSNNYGTTINTTEFSLPDTELVVTQTQNPNTSNISHYQNGYLAILVDNLVWGQEYRVSFKIDNITSNPLNVDLKDIKLLNPYGTFYSSVVIDDNHVVFKKVLWKQYSNTAVNRRNFEIRICGMSFTLSEFMVTPVDEDDFEYEPYQGNINTIDWSSDVGTVYGGYIDLISGELVEEYSYLDLSNLNWDVTSQVGVFRSDDLTNYYVSSITNFICNKYITTSKASTSIASMQDLNIKAHDVNDKYIYIKDIGYTDVAEFKSSLIDCNMVYLLATPITHQLTSTQLQSFVGQNNFWSNADYVEIEYDLIETEDIQKCRKKIMLNQPHTESVINDVVNFTTNIKAPLKECKVYFSPIQEGSGDPSPDNVRNIVGWDGISAIGCGKNLVNVSDETRAYAYVGGSATKYTEDNNIIIISGVSNGGYQVSCKPNTQYTYSCEPTLRSGGVYLRVWELEEKYNGKEIPSGNLSVNQNVNSAAGSVVTFTTKANTHYLVVGFYIYSTAAETGLTISDFQLELGDIRTSYEPYQGTTTSVSWSNEVGTVYGGYVDLAKGELVATHVIFEKKWSEYSNNYAMTDVNRRSILFPYERRKIGAVRALCNIASPAHDLQNKIHFYIAPENNYIYMFLPKDLDEETLIQVASKIKEPIHYSLTPQQLLTFKGENNIWSDTNGQTEVKFWTH